MPQFLILAHDISDKSTLERRLSVRPDHLDRMRDARKAGIFIMGGATLDPEGRMNGSMMLVQMESIEEVNSWIRMDPYVTGRVWEKFDIHPFRMAEV